MAKLTADEIDAFLSRPRIAHFTTLRSSGTPHVTPVWFLWKDGKAMVMADAGAVKVRNIRRNPAVALCVATQGRPYTYVTVEGQASLPSEGLAETVQEAFVLYEGPELGPEYADIVLANENLALIAISPDRFLAWKDDEE